VRPEDDHQLTGADDLRHRLLLVTFDVGHGRGDHEQVLVVLFELRAPVSVNGVSDDELVDVEELSQGGNGAFGGFVEPHPHEPFPILGCGQGELQVEGVATRPANPPGPHHLRK